FASSEPAGWAGSIPINLALPSDSLFFVLAGPAAGPGCATWPLPIPDVQGFVGLDVYFQLFAADPASPQRIAASRGLEIPLRGPVTRPAARRSVVCGHRRAAPAPPRSLRTA